MAVAIGGVVRFNMIGRAFDQLIENEFFYRVEGSTATVANLLAGFVSMWDTVGMNDFMSDQYANLGLEVAEIVDVEVSPTSPNYFRWIYGESSKIPHNSALDGLAPGDACPTYVTANAQKFSAGLSTIVYVPAAPTNTAGEKRFKGRFGISPIPVSYIDTDDRNLLSEAALADFQDSIEDMVVFATADTIPATCELINISVYRNNQFRALGGSIVFAYQTVAAVIGHQPLGSQTTRKRRHLAY